MMKLRIKWVDAVNHEGYWQYNEMRTVADIQIHECSTDEEAERAIVDALGLRMPRREIKWNIEGDLIEMLDAQTDEPLYCAIVSDL